MKKFEQTYNNENESAVDNKEQNLSFIELYTKLYNENFEELEKLRKKEMRVGMVILTIALLFTLSGILCPFLIPVISIGMFICIIWLIVTSVKQNKQHLESIKNAQSIDAEGDSIVVKDEMSLKILKKDSYKGVFKEKIITPIIENFIPSSQYIWYRGLKRSEYRKGQWEGYDLYDSEDQIIAPIKISGLEEFKSQLAISEVHTQNESTDSDGNTHRTTIFHGLAGQIDLPKSIGCYIKVTRNKIKLFGKRKKQA